MKKKNKRNKSKRRLKKKALIIFLVIIIIIFITVFTVLNTHITNIYIKNNNYLSDEEIIDIARLKDYPTIIDANTLSIKTKLEKNLYIRKAKVYKKGFFNQVYIEVYENYPLFYYHDKTYLYNLKTTNDKHIVPIVTNDIPDDIYNDFINALRGVDLDILERISEIKYDSNGIDNERFYLTMNDGIYVYLTLSKFDKINDYDEIVSTLGDKKGILYLDSGEYFEIFKN